MFSSKEMEENENNFEDSGRRNNGLLILLGILFLPAVLIGILFRLLLVKKRQRLSVIWSTVILIDVILVISWIIIKPFDKGLDVIQHITEIQDNWTNLLPLAIIINIALGGVIGLGLTHWEVYQMKQNPHRLQLPGTWTYQFKYERTPLEIFKLKKKIENLKKGLYSSQEKAPLGLDETYKRDNIVYRYDTEAQKHTLIVGASGSGKTFTMLSLILNDIESRKPLVIIDFKRSPELASKVAKWTEENGGDFYHFVNGKKEKYNIEGSKGQSYYDPLIGGSPTTNADMILGMREYDTASAVYKGYMQELLQVLFSMLEYADRKKAPHIEWESGGILRLASALYGANLTELAAACEGTPIQKSAEQIDMASRSKTSGTTRAIEELKGQLRTIVASEYGEWLKRGPEGQNINIFELTQKPGTVILFSLNSDSEPEFASYIGSIILSDLTTVSANRRNAGLKNQVNVYVDEFQAVNPTSVTSLLEKSRESKLALTLAQQSFEQVIAASERNGEAYLLSILDTCSNFIVHNGTTHDSAERLSKILGKEWVTSYRSSNKNENFLFSLNWSNKRNQTVQTFQEERWVFEPQEFMKLSSPSASNGYKATAIFVNKTSDDPSIDKKGGAIARRVWIIPNDALLDTYYSSNNQPLLPLVKEEEKIMYSDSIVSRIPASESREEKIIINRNLPLPDIPKIDSTIINPYSQEDEDDGGFIFEKVEEEIDIPKIDFNAPARLPQQPKEQKREIHSAQQNRTESSFISLFNEKTKPQVRKINDGGLPDIIELPDID